MSLTEEESNFIRFYFLNLKIATKAARVYFDYVHPPAGLASELTKSSVTLRGLRFMTKLQLNILYPSPGQTVTSAEFDTTLIVCLLRNLPPRESAPITGWDNLPHPNDNSTGADLARVKWYINQSVHSKDGILSATDFNQWWGDLEGAIGRLSAKAGLPMLKEAQLAKHVVLDGSLTDMLLELRSCKKSQQELTEKINNQQSSIDILMSNKEEHEKKIHQVNVSHQKGEAKKQKLSTEPIVYKDECTKKQMAQQGEQMEIQRKHIAQQDWFYKLKMNCDGIDTHCIIDQRLGSKYGHLSSLCRMHVRLVSEHCVHTNITRPRPQIQQDSLSEFECIYLSNTNNNDRDSLLMKNILKDALTNNYDILIRWVIAHMKENGVKLEDMKKTLNLAVKKSNINIAKAISWFITRKFFSEFGTQLAEAIDIYPGIRCLCPVSLLVEDPFCTNIKVIVILTRKTILEKPDKYHGFEIEEINPDLSNSIDSEAVTISNLLSTKYTNSYSLKVDLSQYKVETVFNCHSNITLICPSVLKSRSFSKAHDVQERICIQLYCIKKGIIPLGEDHFPLSINGIPTDVIDGTIGLMTKLRIGDQIGPQTSIGTLGGFVKYLDFDCFLTCAHVMYDLQALLSSSYDFARFPGANAYCHTVQGLVDCGKVIWRSFDHDDKLKTSIDAALVLMQNNAHFDQTDYILDGFGNACPYTKLGLSTPFLNDCCLDREDFCIPHQAATVVGAGSQTKLEQNVIFPKPSDVDILFSSTGQTASLVNGNVFQPLWINSPAHIQIATGFLTEKRIFRMYNQIVLNLGLHPGDSGTCIYVVHHPFNNNGCIGMAIAFCGGMTVVTPLKDILKKMNS